MPRAPQAIPVNDSPPTRTVRIARVVRLALSTLVIALSVVALPSTAASQEGDPEVRIDAQRRIDGRIEFALQQRQAAGRWGERQLPARRFFPVDVEDGRWLASSPLTVATTETAQYAARFSALTAGGADRDGHSCGLRDDGTITCWGSNEHRKASPPDGQFAAVTAGGSHSCGLRTDNTITCWGSNTDYQGHHLGQADPPAGQFTAVTAGGNHSCGVRDDGTITCWGDVVAGPPDDVQLVGG